MSTTPWGFRSTAQLQAALPVLGGEERGIVAPFQFVLDGTENLRVSSANSLAGVAVRIVGRRVDDAGQIVDLEFTHVPNSDRTIKTDLFPVGAGAVLNLLAYASAGAPVRGQTFVKVDIVRGFSGATLTLATVLQDYVTSFQALAWPASPIHSSLDGRGYLHSLVLPDPPPGNAVITAAPANTRWRVQTVTCGLTCSAAAGSRGPMVQTFIGAFITASYISPQTIAPGVAGSLTWASGGTPGQIAIASGNLVITTAQIGPDVWITGATQIQVAALQLDPADQFGGTVITIEEWLELN